MVYLRLGGSNIGKLPLKVYRNSEQLREYQTSAVYNLRTLFQLLEAFECNLEFVLVCKLGGVVDNLDTEKGDNRHFGQNQSNVFVLFVSGKQTVVRRGNDIGWWRVARKSAERILRCRWMQGVNGFFTLNGLVSR